MSLPPVPPVELNHPLVTHHLTRLREATTPHPEFRAIVKQLSIALAMEALKDLPLAPHTVQTPLAPFDGARLSKRLGLVPILRAGLGMVDPMLELLPEAEVWHLGMYRDESTATPVTYYSKLEADAPVEIALVLDPMLATGGSATSAIGALLDWGVQDVRLLSIIAAQEGLDRVHGEYPQTRITVCTVDPELNEHKFIVPGLGDAGDRIFGTTGGHQ